MKKRVLALFLVKFLLLTMFLSIEGFCLNANAAVDSDDKFEIKYDKSLYNVYWFARKRLIFRSQYGSWWSDLDEGDRLGTATIKTCYLQPKKKMGSGYYGIACCKVSMDPCDVDGTVTGMSQYAKIDIRTVNPDSRICLPTVSMINAQVKKENNTSSTFSFNIGVKYNNISKSWERSNSGIVYSNSGGTSTSFTYNTTNINLIQKMKNGSYCTWEYDYISHDGDLDWNAYLMSSSSVYGQVLYRLMKKPTSKNIKDCAPDKIQYDIRFGAGDKSNGKVADRFGPSTNRSMSILTGTIEPSF